MRKNQSAFIQGRQLLDPILVANELVDEYKTKKEKDGSYKARF